MARVQGVYQVWTPPEDSVQGLLREEVGCSPPDPPGAKLRLPTGPVSGWEGTWRRLLLSISEQKA